MATGLEPQENLLIIDLLIDDFNLWLEAFGDYVELTRKNVDDQLKKTLFLSIAGLEMRRLVNGLTITDDKFESIIIAIKKFLKPVTNIILERHRFFGLQRNESEDIASFLVRLRRQSKLCNFANEEIDSVSNQLVRDQLIKGLNNSKLTEHILAAVNLSLNDTVSRAEAIYATSY